MTTITFKLSDDLVAKLKHRATQTGTDSLHKQAKQIVTDYLNDTGRTRILNRVGELREEVISLRDDFATAVTALLCNAGKCTPDEAQAWVEKRFL